MNHAFVSLIEVAINTLDNKELACGVFIYLQKVIDNVNHRILLSKLEHYGVRRRALEWFKSYLSDRQTDFYTNGCNSNSKSVTCGVSQDSVLGPLPFLIYISDLPNASNEINFIFSLMIVISTINPKMHMT